MSSVTKTGEGTKGIKYKLSKSYQLGLMQTLATLKAVK
jgi:hypothetical protein